MYKSIRQSLKSYFLISTLSFLCIAHFLYLSFYSVLLLSAKVDLKSNTKGMDYLGRLPSKLLRQNVCLSPISPLVLVLKFPFKVYVKVASTLKAKWLFWTICAFANAIVFCRTFLLQLFDIYFLLFISDISFHLVTGKDYTENWRANAYLEIKYQFNFFKIHKILSIHLYHIQIYIVQI